MIINTAQWNVGGCYITKGVKEDQRKFDTLDIQYIIDTLKEYNPDIITLQEIQKNAQSDQLAYIAKQLNLPNFIVDDYAPSHMDSNQRLGHGIISKYKILSHDFSLYINPGLTVQRPNGDIWKTHDKGISKYILDLGDLRLTVKNTHILPLKKFGTLISSPDMETLRSDIIKNILPIADHELLQGDFNYPTDKYCSIFPELIGEKLSCVNISTPNAWDGTTTDYILYKGMRLGENTTKTTLTDRFPTFCQFFIE